MAASSDGAERRRRYRRAPLGCPLALTPPKTRALGRLARYGFLAVPQLARLEGVSERTARRHCRDLFDGELLDAIAVPRAALAAPGDGNGPDLAFGSAPGIFALSPAGRRVAEELGIEVAPRPAARYGPRNSLFLAHELEVRDFAVWLELAAGGPGHSLAAWRDGPAAWIELGSPEPPRQARSDAWFAFALGERALVGLVEIDRGSERGLEAAGSRWAEKVVAYRRLFASGRLQAVTGYRNARVLVIAATARRRDALAEFVARQAPELGARFWFAHRADLDLPGLSRPAWRRAGSAGFLPLVPPELLGAEGDTDGTTG